MGLKMAPLNSAGSMGVSRSNCGPICNRLRDMDEKSRNFDNFGGKGVQGHARSSILMSFERAYRPRAT